MDLVIDANILFSILIRNGKTEELLFEPDLHLFAPEFIFEEFDKYKLLILKKTNRTESNFNEIFEVIKKKIKTIPNEETDKYIAEAKKICPDENDADYFALAIKMRCAVWSNDKELKLQNKIQVYNTTELLGMFP